MRGLTFPAWRVWKSLDALQKHLLSKDSSKPISPDMKKMTDLTSTIVEDGYWDGIMQANFKKRKKIMIKS